MNERIERLLNEMQDLFVEYKRKSLNRQIEIEKEISAKDKKNNIENEMELLEIEIDKKKKELFNYLGEDK